MKEQPYQTIGLFVFWQKKNPAIYAGLIAHKINDGYLPMLQIV